MGLSGLLAKPIDWGEDRMRPAVHWLQRQAFIPFVRWLGDTPPEVMQYHNGTLWVEATHDTLTDGGQHSPEYQAGRLAMVVGVLPVMFGIGWVVLTPVETLKWVFGMPGAVAGLGVMLTGIVFTLAAMEVMFNEVRVEISSPDGEILADGGVRDG